MTDNCDSSALHQKRVAHVSTQVDAIVEAARERKFDYKCYDGHLKGCLDNTKDIDLCYKDDVWFDRPHNCKVSNNPRKFKEKGYCLCECYKKTHLINLNPVFSDIDIGM